MSGKWRFRAGLSGPDKLAIENLVVCLVLQLQENADFSLPLVWWKPFGNMYGDPKDSVNVVPSCHCYR